MAKPTLSVFTGSENLGYVFSESVQLNNKFWQGDVPFTDDTGHFALNILGKNRYITVQGACDGVGFSGATQELKLRDFVETVDSWINGTGAQTSEVYTTSIGIAYDVKCVDFTWSRLLKDPNRILYSFIFVRV